MKWVPLLAAPALGVAATFGFAPFDLSPLPVLALAALFWLARAQSWRRAFLTGWLFGVAHFASGIYWVYISTHVYGGAPAWLSVLLGAALFSYLALYPAAVLALGVRLRLFNRARGWIGIPALWLLAELVRGWFYSGFPWLSLGYVAVDLPLKALAPIGGVHLMSAWLAALAYALFRAADTTGPQRVRAAGVAGALVAAGFVLPQAASWTREDGAPLDTAIIQGNIAQDQKWLPEMRMPTLHRFRDMTLAAADADLIVWPEVALTQRYEQVREGFLQPLGEQVVAVGGGAVLGGIVISSAEPKGHYNSLVAFGAAQGRYDKRHLVPFGEYFPIPDWLRPIMDVLGTPYSDFLFGADEQPPIRVGPHRVGISICFEDVFGSEIRLDARDAGFLVNVTNDAWFGRSSAAHQHLQIARLRALETGRVIVRAANTGISAIIGADGRLQARAGHFTTEILRAPVQPRTGLTPYARAGNAPLWIAALAMFAILILIERSRGQRAPVERPSADKRR